MLLVSGKRYSLREASLDMPADIPAPIEAITQAGGGSARPFTSLYVPHFSSCTFVG